MKTKVGLVFGGNSSEHDVSIRSARNIYKNIDKKKYQIVPFFMNSKGVILSSKASYQVLLGKKLSYSSSIPNNNLFHNIINLANSNIDIFFPIIHGNFGEDGTIQGLFRLLNKPYVGSGIKASANAFDKDTTKKLLDYYEIRNTPSILLTKSNYRNYSFKKLSNLLGKLIFVKPTNQGSSVGINQVKNQKELDYAIKNACQYDNKILVEKAIKGLKEVEVAVIGNNKIKVSIPGAIKVPKKDKFYTYYNKFVNSSGVNFEIPASIPIELVKEIQKMSIETYKALELSGMARIDFLVSKDNIPYVGEANTLPGFTNISLFPQLWKQMGISETKLITKLIKLGFARYNNLSKLSHKYIPLKD